MTIDSFDTVILTSIFILPGFVISTIVERINPSHAKTTSNYFLSCFCFSLINCACIAWLLVYIINQQYKHAWRMWLFLFIASLVSSLVIGMLVAIIRKTNLIKKIFDKIGISSIYPIPTAWDYIFSKQEPAYVIITLNDYSVVYGLFSNNSFASSDIDKKDIFLEKTFKVNQFGEWEDDEESKGIYISNENIIAIEFKGGIIDGKK